jgi:hypothetical protein
VNSIQNRVVFGLGFRGSHAQIVRRAGSGHQRTKLAKEGAASERVVAHSENGQDDNWSNRHFLT